MILSSTSKNNSKSNNTSLCVYLQLNTYNERTMQLKYSQFELPGNCAWNERSQVLNDPFVRCKFSVVTHLPWFGLIAT